MGRHAADRPGRPPLHADLFAPAPGTAAAYAARERAAEAFDRLVEPHRDALEAYVLRLTDGDRAAADSVLKETFYRAAQDPARYPPRASAVRPWLVLTARTVLRDGERSAPAGHDDRPVVAPAERSPSPLAETTVVGAMNDLADAHREILVELFYQGVSLESAAAARGVPVATLKSRLYFAMRALRAVLDQRTEPGPDPRHRR
ncbi:sigma factor-like helix-turn-helix DNA-binding protein [Nucisporomicrobium flavum]|uniref:sigma factor-like helix-turn-helix DNA-binding protein n=1 Tax=Nucisporomicrobium flavum TaxID=2785915 RepID=UPI0018F71234|nr:sigma factor-like helix-turn-helix DNA-binding protein [Nucisporomicrobium flavum]